MEQFNFVGKNLTKNKLDQSENKVLDDIILGQELFTEELEKTEFEKDIILLGDVILENEFERLGLQYNHFIPEEHIHVLTEEMGNEVLPNGSSAVFDPYEQQICIVRRDNESKIQIFHDLLHEMVHCVSKIKYKISEDDSIHNYRIGYAIKNKEKDKKFLEAFNEALTEDLTQDLLYRNKEHVFEKFNIKNFKQSPGAYEKEIELVDLIIKGISNFNKEPEHLIRDRFYKGLFTGEIMSLRDIENCFGKSSLQILSLLDTEKTTSLLPLYVKYFSINTSNEERHVIKENITNYLLNNYDSQG